MKGFHVFILILLIKNSYSWDTEELELFDLVEEVNSNFYEEFGLKSDADVSEIRKAYRKLSLQYHPDKNKEPGAEVKFRQLVAMYEVLKDEERRKKYDQVLEFGLPDWKQPVYYYRKVRKLGLLEMTVILFFIFTVGHFFVIWAAYYEKKFEMEEVFNSRKKKDKRGRKAKIQQALQEEELEQELQKMLNSIPRPRSSDLLPFKLTRWVYNGLLSIPGQVQAVKIEWERKKRLQQKREERQRQLEEEAKMEREKRTKRKRVQVLYERDVCESTEKPVSYTPVHSMEEEESRELKTEDWSSEDYILLAKAVAKYPGGTSNRWERIASLLNRDVSDVIAKSKELKTDFCKPVETAAQGITGTVGENVQIKKGKAISAEISKRSDFVEDIQTTDSSVSVNNKKPKPAKKNKSAERTNSVISQTSNVSSELNKGAESETSHMVNDHSIITQSNKPTEEKKKVSFSSETKSITSDALAKSVKEKMGKITVDSAECIVGSSGGEDWTQNQQKIFEWALTQYPRGVEDRWDKMAQHIPGKSKEDCIIRFKYLAEVIKKKKQLQQQ